MHLLKAVFWFVYFIVGMISFGAAISGLHSCFGMNIHTAAMLALFAAPVPVLGQTAGIFGALAAWGWSAAEAFALFILPLALCFGALRLKKK